MSPRPEAFNHTWDYNVSLFGKDPLSFLDRKRVRIERLETIYCEAARQVCSVNRIPVTLTNAWLNIWSWTDPITPYEQQIARNGGYYRMRDNQQRGILL